MERANFQRGCQGVNGMTILTRANFFGSGAPGTITVMLSAAVPLSRTVIGGPVAHAQQVLNEKAGYFHSLLFKRMSIHTIPRLTFVPDTSVEHGIEIDRLIDEANRDRS